MTFAQLRIGLRSYPLQLAGWWHGWRFDRSFVAQDRHRRGLRKVADTSDRLRLLLGGLPLPECSACDDDGWLWDAAQGKVPCDVCDRGRAWTP